jgi:uncharacterized protein YcgI (DUF1989 family)
LQHGKQRHPLRRGGAPLARLPREFLVELAKYGMSKRDIVANLNFFMKVSLEKTGRLAIVDGVEEPGNFVDLKAEMDVLCVISNCPQINNPCNGFDPTPIELMILASA